MRSTLLRIAGMAGVLLAVGMQSARADTLTWTGMTGDWHAVENWTNSTAPEDTRVPADGDEVAISQSGARVSLAASSAWLGSLTLSGASLVMSNWDTLLSATNVEVLSGGELTCAGPFTNNAMSNRVNLVCSNLLVAAGGAVNVSGKGFSGGINTTNTYEDGHGPGGRDAGGAGYGGQGGRYNSMALRTNSVYGNPAAPLEPGSGGEGGAYKDTTFGGHGGGAVRIVAGQVVVSGGIKADGTPGSFLPPAAYAGHASGGSGGGIYITCRTITGTNGSLTADGSGAVGGGSTGNGGGGGRIAVIYDSAEQALLPRPAITFSAMAGMGGWATNFGDIGTIYLTDSRFFSPTNLFNGQWLAPITESFSLNDWTVSNVWARLSGLTMNVSNLFTITGTNLGRHKLEITNACTLTCSNVLVRGAVFQLGGRGAVTGPVLTCSGNLLVTNRGWFCVNAGLTYPGAQPGYGALVTVGQTLQITSNGWVFPGAHPTNGAVPLFALRDLQVAKDGGINAAGLGFGGGASRGDNTANVAYGPGISTNTSVSNASANGGSGYGGRGYPGDKGSGGLTYGHANAPVEPGSGARSGLASGDSPGPNGGGSVQIRAEKTVSVDGLISASGGLGSVTYGGGSSGGAIYITCDTFIGTTNGALLAEGGNAAARAGNYGGGGGGGRIAVWRMNDLSAGAVSNSVLGGLDSSRTNIAESGTIVWGWLPVPGTVISFR